MDGPIYSVDQLSTFTNGNSIHDVVIALPPARLNEVKGIAPALEKLCVPTRVVIDLGDGIVPRDRLTALGGFQMLDLRPTLAETGSYLFQKRIFDISFSILILFITLPDYSSHCPGNKVSQPRTSLFCSGSRGTEWAGFPDVQIPHHESGQPARRRHALDKQS